MLLLAVVNEAPLPNPAQLVSSLTARRGEQVLDWSKIEAGRLTLESTALSPADVVQQTKALFGSKTREAGLQLAVTNDLPEQLWVKGDPVRFAQVVNNLVSNAIKYTPPGGTVGVKLSTRPAAASGRIVVRVAVTDTGIGISPEAQARLFQPFRQASVETARMYGGGTGLGLSISKRLVELMGGFIGMESREGAGSTFWFELDMAVSAAPEGPRGSVQSLRSNAGCRVLLVDDNSTNR